MDYYDMDTMAGLNTGGGNESLMRQRLRIRDREEELKEQMKAARAMTQPQGQVVGNGGFQHYVAPHWTQQATPIAAQIATEIQRRGLQADQTGLDAIEMKEAKAHLANMPPDNAPQAVKLEWAEKGKELPSLRSLMTDYAKDQLIQAPVRAEARDERKQKLSDAIAEAQRKQSDELDYRRTRDQQRQDDAAANRDLRSTIAAAVHGAGGRDKASNYQIVTDAQGNSSRVNKLTGEVLPLGAVGRQDLAITKKAQEAATSQGNSQDALGDIAEAKKLLPNATGSGVGAAIDKLYRGVGSTNEGMKANRQLKVIAGRLTASVPRFEGPQSDKDVMAYREQAADVGNESLTTAERMEALKQVELMHRRVIQNAPRAKAAATGQSGPSIREAVQAAIKPHEYRGVAGTASSAPASVDDLLNKYK